MHDERRWLVEAVWLVGFRRRVILTVIAPTSMMHHCRAILLLLTAIAGCQSKLDPPTLRFSSSNSNALGTHLECEVQLPSFDGNKEIQLQIRRVHSERIPEQSVTFPTSLKWEIPAATDGNCISTPRMSVVNSDRPIVNLSWIELQAYVESEQRELIGGSLNCGSINCLQSNFDFLVGDAGSWVPLRNEDWRDNQLCVMMMRRSTDDRIIDYFAVVVLEDSDVVR